MNKKNTAYYSIIYFIKQVVSIIIPLLTVPYVSRVLSVKNIGIVNYSNSIISYFTLFAIFGINVYGVRELSKVRDSMMRRNTLISELCMINMIIMLIVYIILFFLIYSNIFSYEIFKYLLISSVQIMFYTFSWEWVLNSYEEYVFLAILSIITYLFTALATFLLVKNNNDTFVYLILTFAGNIITSIISYVYIKIKLKIQFMVSKKFLKHFKNILPIFFNTLCQSIYVNIDTIMIGSILNTYNVGLYSSSTRIYVIYKSLISTPITVSISKCSNLYFTDKRKYNNFIQDLCVFFIMAGIPLCFFMLVSSKEIISILFGLKYLKSIETLQILTISVIFSIMNIFINSLVLIPQNKEKLLLKLSLISASLNIFLNIFFIKIFGINGAAITTLISELIIVFFSFKYLRESLIMGNIKNCLFQGIVGSIILFMTKKVIQRYIYNVYLYIFLSFILGTVIYMLYLFITKNQYFLQTIKKIKM